MLYFCTMSRLLAIDYGQKRVGIAVTDEEQIIASALTTLHSKEVISFLKDYLSKVDNTLKNIIKSNTIPKISKSNDYILDLYKYIIFQQISTKAGNSIFNRFLHYYKANKKNIASWSENEWTSIGLSKQKKNYIENIFDTVV